MTETEQLALVSLERKLTRLAEFHQDDQDDSGAYAFTVAAELVAETRKGLQ